MPQFRPYWWINIISWTLFTFSFLIGLTSLILLPSILKGFLLRTK